MDDTRCANFDDIKGECQIKIKRKENHEKRAVKFSDNDLDELCHGKSNRSKCVCHRPLLFNGTTYRKEVREKSSLNWEW